MTCRKGICHAIQGALLGSLIGHAVAVALRPPAPRPALTHTTLGKVYEQPSSPR